VTSLAEHELFDDRLAEAQRAEAAYVADPGDHTLPAFLRAWDGVLLALDEAIDIDVQAMAAPHGAVAHLQVFRHYGDDGHARIAIDLLERVREHASSEELRFAASADLATLRFDRYQADGRTVRLCVAVTALEDVLRECPNGSAFRAVLLANLGSALAELARRRADPALLDRAVTLHEEAVATVAHDGPVPVWRCGSTSRPHGSPGTSAPVGWPISTAPCSCTPRSPSRAVTVSR